MSELYKTIFEIADDEKKFGAVVAFRSYGDIVYLYLIDDQQILTTESVYNWGIFDQYFSMLYKVNRKTARLMWSSILTYLRDQFTVIDEEVSE